ncbi:MAG: S1/P1 Nuclease [Flavobacteriales bacterium]|nr:S1/P1 Nuclease [Flavobacteriales bacterium]
MAKLKICIPDRTFGKWLSIAALAICGFSQLSFSPWGFHGHREINTLAIYTLPEGMFGFYKSNADFIRRHAVDPDKRRYSVKGEAERHYIDIDHYCHHGDTACDPFEEVPRNWFAAVDKFSEDTLHAYGIVPWHVNLMVIQLTKAFEDRNTSRILRLSAELGHYVGDAHVPLHTTENYNGQLTNQKGIHGFWESRLPELYDRDYDFFVGRAKYVENPNDFIWDVVEESHYAVDSVLSFEAQLNAEWPEDKKYAYEERGVALVKTYSEEYSREYHRRLNNQVERRMKQAVIALGSLWYTAWVNAGQPDLEGFKLDVDPEQLEQEIAKETDQPEQEELKTRTHDN